MRTFFVSALAVVVAACSSPVDSTPTPLPTVDPAPRWANLAKACPDNAPAYSLPEVLRAKADTPSLIGGIARDAYIARYNPGGWGGRAFRDGDHYNMYMVDPADTAELFATLRARQILIGSVLLKGRWDYAQMFEWNSYIQRQAFAPLRGYLSIDNEKNHINAVVSSETERLQLDGLLSELDIPCFLVTIEVQVPDPNVPRGG